MKLTVDFEDCLFHLRDLRNVVSDTWNQVLKFPGDIYY